MSKTILVVDDDHSIISIFEFILQQAGYHTITASSGQECIDLINSGQQIDLAFLDVKMPGLSGIETFRKIQEIRPLLS